MRRERLLIPLTLLILLAPAGTAGAADWTVGAMDYVFTPESQQIAVGDTVTWSFANDGHTTTAVEGQAERWDSGTKLGGTTFPHTFTRPGRFQYICVPHQTFPMKGVITVGTDTVVKSASRLKAKRIGSRVKVSFRLAEPGRATYSVKGPARKSVGRERFAAGARSLTLKGLKPGRYRGTLTVSDDFDKKTVLRNSFRVPAR
jgi:plastocyanin